MANGWPTLTLEQWRESCDTPHARPRVLGRLAGALAPPEPELQPAALRLSARGWETLPLPAPDGSGAFTVVLDLHFHQVVVEHDDGGIMRIALEPDRSVGEVTREVLAAVEKLAGKLELALTPQETSWQVSLDE